VNFIFCFFSADVTDRVCLCVQKKHGFNFCKRCKIFVSKSVPKCGFYNFVFFSEDVADFMYVKQMKFNLLFLQKL
jgi:hypothetical protein